MPVASQGTEVGQDGFGRTKVTSFSREVEIFEGGLLPCPLFPWAWLHVISTTDGTYWLAMT